MPLASSHSSRDDGRSYPMGRRGSGGSPVPDAEAEKNGSQPRRRIAVAVSMMRHLHLSAWRLKLIASSGCSVEVRRDPTSTRPAFDAWVRPGQFYRLRDIDWCRLALYLEWLRERICNLTDRKQYGSLLHGPRSCTRADDTSVFYKF